MMFALTLPSLKRHVRLRKSDAMLSHLPLCSMGAWTEQLLQWHGFGYRMPADTEDTVDVYLVVL